MVTSQELRSWTPQNIFCGYRLQWRHDFEDARGLPIYSQKDDETYKWCDDFQQCGWNDINAFLWTRDGELIAKVSGSKSVQRFLSSDRVYHSRNGVRPMDLLNPTK